MKIKIRRSVPVQSVTPTHQLTAGSVVEEAADPSDIETDEDAAPAIKAPPTPKRRGQANGAVFSGVQSGSTAKFTGTDMEAIFLTQLMTSDAESLESVKAMKIQPTWFSDSVHKAVWEFMTEHVVRHGTYPSVVLVQSSLNFKPMKGDDPLRSVAEHLLDRAMYGETHKLLVRAQTLMALRKHREVLALLGNDSSDIVLRHNPTDDLTAANAGDSLIDRYMKTEAKVNENQGMMGVAWPWELYNEATGGIGKTDMIVIYAQAKVGKTWTALEILLCAALQGETVVICTKEIKKHEIMERLHCLYMRVAWGDYRRGKLKGEDRERFVPSVQEFTQLPIVIFEVQSMGLMGVSEFRAKILEHKPRLAVFDGFYFLAPDGDWKALTQCTRQARQVSLTTNTAVILVTQSNKDGDAGYTRSWQQDATHMIRVTAEEAHLERKEALVETTFARDFQIPPMLIDMKPGISLSQKAVLDGGGDTSDGAVADVSGDDGLEIVDGEVVE